MYLLDINCIIALLHPDHVHHQVSYSWFKENRSKGWYVCESTILGAQRISIHLCRGAVSDPLSAAKKALASLCANEGYQELADISTALSFPAIPGIDPSNVVDGFLVALALKHNLTLVSFDKKAVQIAQERGCQAFSPH